MTPPLHFVVPGPIDQRTGGYIYDQLIVHGLRALGWTVQVLELAGRFPQADELAYASAAEAIETMSPGAVLVIDGLAGRSDPSSARFGDRPDGGRSAGVCRA
jgi:hypothetical protein